MAGIDYAAVRQRIAIRRILELIDYQPAIVRTEQWRGPCPIADHASARDCDRCFSVNLSRHVFRCFRCECSGNQIDLWAAITHQSLYPATIDLCRRLGIETPRVLENHNSNTGHP